MRFLTLSVILSVVTIWDVQANGGESSSRSIESTCSNEGHELPPNVAYVPEGFDRLRDILPEICSHLNIRDLCSVQAVCSEFQVAARRVLARAGPKAHSVPIQKQLPEGPVTERLTNLVQVKPALALLFSDHELPPGAYRSVSEELLSHYLPELPRQTPIIYFEGLAVFVDSEDIRSVDNRALGIFFPDNGKAEILTSTLGDHFFLPRRLGSDNDVIKGFFDKVTPRVGEKTSQIGLLIFHLQLDDEEEILEVDRFSRVIVEDLKKKYLESSGQLAIWGGHVNWLSTVGLGLNSIFPTNTFAMSISGNTVRSWSLVIDTTANTEDISRKIHEFHRMVVYDAKSSVALSLQTTLATEGRQERLAKISLFSRTFLGLKHVSFGIPQGFPKYCADTVAYSGTYAEPQIKFSEVYICYMVISYR